MSTPEPTYTYIKGHGWQPVKMESFTFTHKDKRVTIVAKNPDLGECGARVFTSNTTYLKDGKVNLREFARWYIENDVKLKPQTPEGFEKAQRDVDAVGYGIVWVTFYVD